MTELHEMTLRERRESGAEEWLCPDCGRLIAMTWRPFDMLVLSHGDESAVHSGSKGSAALRHVRARQAMT